MIIKFAVNIPKIPECNSLVCTTSGKDKLTVGVETQAVHLNVLISSVMWGEGEGCICMFSNFLMFKLTS